MTDQIVEIRMEEWFAAAYRDDARAKEGKPLDTTQQFRHRHRLRVVVVFVTVSTGEVAPSNRDQMHVDWLTLELERPGEHTRLTESSAKGTHRTRERSMIHRRFCSMTR